MTSNTRVALLLVGLLLLAASRATFALVPTKETFRYVNDGELGDLRNEYSANYRTTPIGTSPFQLMFYNTTPDAFTLAYLMGDPFKETPLFWVWEANRGRPVREGATLSLGPDGDLVLAEADGTVVWHTDTAYKGVVALRSGSNGNLVLVDGAGRTVWQSFGTATDTLLVGQSLTVGDRLVSRKSIKEGVDGRYNFNLVPSRFIFELGSGPESIVYGRISPPTTKTILNVTFTCSGRTLRLVTDVGAINLATAKKSCRLSFLRMGIDGDLVVQTYDEHFVDNEKAWDRSFSYFSGAKSCDLPSRCGALGVCKSGKCVSCPAPRGPVPWTSACTPPVRGPCGGSSVAPSYYKVVGVEHVLNKFSGAMKGMKVAQCRKLCDDDCSCVGFFFWEDNGNCWLATELDTLITVDSTSHVAYIKLS